MRKQCFTRAWPAALIVTVALEFPLVSCSPESSSPPPFVPYKELSRDEIAKANYAVGNIRASQHGTIPTIIVVQPPTLLPLASSNHGILTVENKVNCRLAFYIKGPQHWVFAISAGRSERLSLEAGKYAFAVDTHECGDVPPLYGEGNVRAERSYLLSLASDDMGRGRFDLENKTGKPVTVNVADANYLVQNLQSLELPSGTYKAVVDTNCGKITREIEVKQNMRQKLTVWCKESSRISISSPDATTD